MRILIRVLIAIGVLFGIGAIALAVFLPPYVDSPEFRELISSESEAAIGRRLEFDDLGVGFLPPSILVERPWIAGANTGDANFFEASTISLRLAILPLFTGTVLVDSLVVDGARIEIIQSADGLSIPTPPAPDVAAAPEEETSGGGSPVSIAVRSVELRDAELSFVDRLIEPPTTISLVSLDVTATGGSSPTAPIAIALDAELPSGGSLSGAGSATLAGHVDLELELDAIALDFAAPYAEGVTALDADLFGTIEVKGAAAAPERLAIALELRAEEIAQGDLVIRGPLLLDIEMSGDLAQPKGKLEFDASDAVILMGPADAPTFLKPVAVPTRVAGRFAVSASGAATVDLSEITLAAMRARAKIEAGDTVRLSLTAPPFDVAGVRGLVPALEALTATGSIEIDTLVVDAEPISIQGAIVLHELRLQMPDAGEVLARGKLTGIGDGLRLVDVRVDLGGQVIAIDGQVTELAGLMPFDAQLASVGVLRASPLLAAVSSVEGVLLGPLELEASIAGRAGDTSREDALIQSLKGGLELQVGRGAGDGEEGGRLVGISIMKTFLDAYEQIYKTTKLAVTLAGKEMPDLDRYTSDEFERLEGLFTVRDGRLHTDSLRIDYRGYGIKLRGSIGLGEQDLDMTGEIKLGAEMIEAMGSDPTGRDFIVPLAHIGGTVEAPDVRISPEAMKSFTTQLLSSNKAIGQEVDKLKGKLRGLFEQK